MSVARGFDLFGSPRARSWVGGGLVWLQEVQHVAMGRLELRGEGPDLGTLTAEYDRTSLQLGLTRRF